MYSICVCVYNALPAYIEDIYLYICIFNTNRLGSLDERGHLCLVSLDFTPKLFFDSCIWNFRCASNRSFLREERERESCVRVCMRVRVNRTKSDGRKRERFLSPRSRRFFGEELSRNWRCVLTEGRGSRSEISLDSNESMLSIINRRVTQAFKGRFNQIFKPRFFPILSI